MSCTVATSEIALESEKIVKSRLVWLMVIFLPLFASCSSTTAILKKRLNAGSPSSPHSVDKKTVSKASSMDEEGAFHIVGAGETLKHICSVYGLDLKKVAAV